MATQKEIDLATEITKLAVFINSQRLYTVFLEFSGHVNLVTMRLRAADNYEEVIQNFESYLSGPCCCDSWQFNTEESSLLGLGEMKICLDMILETDCDGIPL